MMTCAPGSGCVGKLVTTGGPPMGGATGGGVLPLGVVGVSVGAGVCAAAPVPPVANPGSGGAGGIGNRLTMVAGIVILTLRGGVDEWPKSPACRAPDME